MHKHKCGNNFNTYQLILTSKTFFFNHKPHTRKPNSKSINSSNGTSIWTIRWNNKQKNELNKGSKVNTMKLFII